MPKKSKGKKKMNPRKIKNVKKKSIYQKVNVNVQSSGGGGGSGGGGSRPMDIPMSFFENRGENVKLNRLVDVVDGLLKAQTEKEKEKVIHENDALIDLIHNDTIIDKKVLNKKRNKKENETIEIDTSNLSKPLKKKVLKKINEEVKNKILEPSPNKQNNSLLETVREEEDIEIPQKTKDILMLEEQKDNPLEHIIEEQKKKNPEPKLKYYKELITDKIGENELNKFEKELRIQKKRKPIKNDYIDFYNELLQSDEFES